jgi:hypothetical protein
MSHNHHHEEDSRSFIMPAFLAFAFVFSFLVLMANCHGPFQGFNAHGTEQHGAAGHKGAANEEHGATEHKTDTTGGHHDTDTTAHKAEAHSAEHH